MFAEAKESYIALTAHFIDAKDWTLHCLNLACDPFPGHHTAPRVAAKVLDVCREVGIRPENITCAVMDNESTNNAVGDRLPFEWNGCVDHLIETVTKKVNTIPGVKVVLKKARKMSKFYAKSAVSREVLKEVQLANGVIYPVFPIRDMPCRWWSSETMIARTRELKLFFTILKQQKRYPAKAPYLTDQDYELLDVLHLLLNPFMKVKFSVICLLHARML